MCVINSSTHGAQESGCPNQKDRQTCPSVQSDDQSIVSCADGWGLTLPFTSQPLRLGSYCSTASMRRSCLFTFQSLNVPNPKVLPPCTLTVFSTAATSKLSPRNSDPASIDQREAHCFDRNAFFAGPCPEKVLTTVLASRGNKRCILPGYCNPPGFMSLAQKQVNFLIEQAIITLSIVYKTHVITRLSS